MWTPIARAGFPTIKFFYAGSDGSIKGVPYNGGRSAKELVTFAMDKVTHKGCAAVHQKCSRS